MFVLFKCQQPFPKKRTFCRQGNFSGLKILEKLTQADNNYPTRKNLCLIRFLLMNNFPFGILFWIKEYLSLARPEGLVTKRGKKSSLLTFVLTF